MTDDRSLRAQLIRLLEADDAHMTFEDAVADFPGEAVNARPPNVGYTPWHLVEHLRLTQWDILEYVRNPAWVSPEWPIGYWPDPSAVATPAEFAASVARFLADRGALVDLVADPGRDLTAPIPHTPGHPPLPE